MILHFSNMRNLSVQAMNWKKCLSYSFIKHIANSAAIIRHPLLQMDMVRLGIGMYGVDAANTRSAGTANSQLR